jgi:integrase
MGEWAKPRKRSWPEDQRILNVFVLPAWKNRKASEITRGDLKALFKEVSKRGPIVANRVLALLSKVYSFGLMEEIIEANPASRIIKNPKKDRERVLPDDEIRKVWTALEAEEAPVRAIYKLFLLTGQRHDEVCGMRWIELDPERTWWTLLSERTKSGRSHQVALGPQGRALILDRTGRDETYVFPADDSTRDTRRTCTTCISARTRSSSAAGCSTSPSMICGVRAPPGCAGSGSPMRMQTWS